MEIGSVLPLRGPVPNNSVPNDRPTELEELKRLGVRGGDITPMSLL